MPVNLDKPLSWTMADADEAAMLDDLQGNILKSHGRRHTAQVFLHFDNPRGARAFLRALADQVKSAARQLCEAKHHKETGESAGGFVVCFLSYAGYQALGVDSRSIPADPAFRAGMKQRGVALADAPVVTWDDYLQGEIHAMVLIAGDDDVQVEQYLTHVRGIALENDVREIHDPNGERVPIDQRPTGGVGLLFMAYQSDIGSQFEHMQRHWANNPNYVGPGTRIDPIVGQVSADYRWPVGWGEASAPTAAPVNVGSFVTLKGGEYFFAPCVSFLKSLGSEEPQR